MTQSVELCNRLTSAVDRRDGPGCVFLKHSPGFSPRHLAAPTEEELLSQLALEFGHVLGQRRLRRVKLLCRTAEAPLAGNGQEHLELTKGHLRVFPMVFIPTKYWTLYQNPA